MSSASCERKRRRLFRQRAFTCFSLANFCSYVLRRRRLWKFYEWQSGSGAGTFDFYKLRKLYSVSNQKIPKHNLGSHCSIFTWADIWKAHVKRGEIAFQYDIETTYSGKDTHDQSRTWTLPWRPMYRILLTSTVRQIMFFCKETNREASFCTLVRNTFMCERKEFSAMF